MRNSELKEIYNEIIVKEAHNILDNNSGLFFCSNGFEQLSKEYDALHEYFSKKFMSVNSNGLDTHKEIATIVISLLKTKLIKTLDSCYYEDSNIKYAFNEDLAFRVGCGILKSVISCEYEENNEISAEEKEFSINLINSKLLLPKTSYQSYRENVVTEFYYTTREGNYNFLATADKYFWIEYFNKRIIKEQYKTEKLKTEA